MLFFFLQMYTDWASECSILNGFGFEINIILPSIRVYYLLPTGIPPDYDLYASSITLLASITD